MYIKKKVTVFIDKTEYFYLKKEGPLINNLLIKNLGIAHTKGDLIAYHFKTNTYITGDVIFIGRATAFSDANIPMWINVINNKLDLSWNYLIPGYGSIIKNKSKLNDTKNWLYFLDKLIKKVISEGDMISEIFQYAIPKEIYHL